MENRPNPAAPLVWWVLWAANLSGLAIVHFVIGKEIRAEGNIGGVIEYIPIVPLVISCVLRWFVFPKQDQSGKALMIFIAGVALAEGSGIVATLLGREHRAEFLVLAVLGILQWAPFFAGRFYRPTNGEAHGLRTR